MVEHPCTAHPSACVRIAFHGPAWHSGLVPAQTFVQLDLFGGPGKPHIPDPLPQSPEPVPIPPLPELKGQLDLLQSRVVRLTPTCVALADARFDEAMTCIQALPHEGELAAVLKQFVHAACRDANGVAVSRTLGMLEQSAPVMVAGSARRGLLVARARRAESAGPTTAAACLWLEAQRPEEAERTLHACIGAGVEPGRANVLLANMLSRNGAVEQARVLYRRAFWVEPRAVVVGEIHDPAVRALHSSAQYLAPEPCEPWMPLVGFALGVWPFAGCESPDPGCAPALFHAALVRSRVSSRQGQPNVAARREMKTLAPRLFEHLMDEQLL